MNKSAGELRVIMRAASQFLLLLEWKVGLFAFDCSVCLTNEACLSVRDAEPTRAGILDSGPFWLCFCVLEACFGQR